MQQPQQQQVIIIQQPATVVPGGRGRPLFIQEFQVVPFPREAAALIGFLQMLNGIASLIGASLAFVYLAYNYEIAFGFWCGSFFFGSASAALHAGRRPTRRRIKHAIAWAVIAFLFAGTQFGLALDGLIMNVDYPYPSSATYVCWWWYWWATLCYYYYPGMEAANGLMLAAAGVELLLIVAQLSICCKALKEGPVPQATHQQELVDMPTGRHMRRGPQFQQQQATVTYIEAPLQPQQPNFAPTYAAPQYYEATMPPVYAK